MTDQIAETQPNQRTLEQKRAEHAWNCIEPVKNLGADHQGDKSEVRTLAASAPADILTNGLGQTLAFWKAKNKFAHYTLFNAVAGWIFFQGISNNADLLTWIRQTANTDGYRRATAEAIAFLIWVKRFAEAELPREG